jgi:predicted ATPase
VLHLQAVQFNPAPRQSQGRFPFSVPSIASLVGSQLQFSSPITFLVGENGSGKSTVLEALAVSIGSITVGSRPAEHDATLAHIKPLAATMRASWLHKTKRGFYMRAEDFFGYAQHIERMKEELEADRREIEADTSLSAYAKGLATGPMNSQIGALRQSYGDGLDAVSHGESFIRLLQSRLVPDGLFLLDEPEAPLSPMRQLALLSLLKSSIEEQRGQFIVATHSPILMAAPNATIYSFDGGKVCRIAYEETEHYRFTKDFLNDPDIFLRHL